MANNDWFLPYPATPVERFGFMIGDIIALAVIGLIIIPPLTALVR
jgi:hypothetical protein